MATQWLWLNHLLFSRFVSSLVALPAVGLCASPVVSVKSLMREFWLGSVVRSLPFFK